jgi:hypothetical protein
MSADLLMNTHPERIDADVLGLIKGRRNPTLKE